LDFRRTAAIQERKRNWKKHRKTRISLIKDIIRHVITGTKERQERTLEAHPMFGSTNKIGIPDY
jgi:hypothetical protein